MAPSREVINSSRVPRIGPYSQAVRVGNLVFTAGQPGIDPITGQTVGPTFEVQARQAFDNLQAVLEDAGTSLHRVDRGQIVGTSNLAGELFSHGVFREKGVITDLGILGRQLDRESSERWGRSSRYLGHSSPEHCTRVSLEVRCDGRYR
jgi:hypothetical protein